MAIAVGAHDHKQGTTSTLTLSTAGVTTQASGSTFLIGVIAAGASNISSVVDSKSNAYTQIGTTFNTSFGSSIAWYRKENGVGGAGHTITSTLLSGQVQTIYFVEITGAATSSVLDQSVAFVADASSPFTTNTTGTTTQADEIAIALYGTDTPSGTETITWGAGFTQIDADGNSNFVTGGIGFKVLSATGTVQGSLTSSVATDTAGAVATFKAAAGGGINASGNITEANDTIVAGATVPHTATALITEAADTIVAGLTHGANFTFTVTESADTIVAGATQTTAGIGATFTVTEANDTVVAGSTAGENFSFTVTEASDAVLSGATLSDFANLNVTEASDTIVAGATLVSLTNATFNVTEASDTIVSGLTAGENFTLTVTEANDSVVAGMTAGENLSLNVTEASDTIVAGATTLLAGINATFTVTEASDTIQAGLSASITGNVNVTEAGDTAFGFMDTGNPALVVTTVGAGSGGARKKRLYILPDGTRIYATPSEIAQILKLFYQKRPEEKLTKKQKKFAVVSASEDFEPIQKTIPKIYELKPQYRRVQQLDYINFIEHLRNREEEEFLMMMEVF